MPKEWIEVTRPPCLVSVVANLGSRIILGPGERLFNWVSKGSLNYQLA